MRKRIIVIVAVFVVAAVALTATVIAVRENTKDHRPVKTGEKPGSFEIIEKKPQKNKKSLAKHFHL